jgi:hypothetical protein
MDITIKFRVPEIDSSLTWEDIPCHLIGDIILDSYLPLKEVRKELEEFAPYINISNLLPSGRKHEAMEIYKSHKDFELDHRSYKNMCSFITIENDIPYDNGYHRDRGLLFYLLFEYSKLFYQLGLQNITRGDMIVPKILVDIINHKIAFKIACSDKFEQNLSAYKKLLRASEEEIIAISASEYCYHDTHVDYIRAYTYFFNKGRPMKKYPPGVIMRKTGIASHYKHFYYNNPAPVFVILDPSKIKAINSFTYDDSDLMLGFGIPSKCFVISIKVFRTENYKKHIPEELILNDELLSLVAKYSKIRDWRLTGKKCSDPSPVLF